MKIQFAENIHFQDILDINKIIDTYPDNFLKQSLEQQQIFVALDNGQVIAYLLYQYIWGTSLLVSLLMVHPDFQRKGVATLLIDAFEKHFKEKGVKVYISSTELKNTSSQRFHDKLGFQKIGMLDMPYGEEIFYKKQL